MSTKHERQEEAAQERRDEQAEAKHSKKVVVFPSHDEAEARNAKAKDGALQWIGPGYILQSQVRLDHPTHEDLLQASDLTEAEKNKLRNEYHDESVKRSTAAKKKALDASNAKAEAAQAKAKEAAAAKK